MANASAEPGGPAVIAAPTSGRADTFANRLWFGVGQAGEGIANAALGAILMFYFSQVLGLDPRLAGLALLLAIVTDGVSDLLVGAWSDATRHRWGRRHPFMYASILPFGLSFIALFMAPTGLPEWALFTWLLAGSLLARNAMTLFVVPHYALGAELSQDHHGRTVVVSFRAFFMYVGRAAVFLAGAAFFAPSEAYPTGQLDPARYPVYGLTLGCAIILLTWWSTWGTHSVIPYLPKAKPDDRFSFVNSFAEMFRAAKNFSFQIFLLGFFVWVVGNVVFAILQIHLGTYFWELTPQQVFLLPLMGAAAQLIATPIWVRIARRIGKKHTFIASAMGFCLFEAALVFYKVLGFIDTDSSGYLWFVFGGHFVTMMIGAAPAVVAGSMLADIADEYELEADVRREGVMFGTINFIVKISNGVGAQIAGFLVVAAGLQARVDPSLVSADISNRLAWITVSVLLGFGVAAALLYLNYPLTRARHADVQAALRARRDEAAP
ncbi:MAG: MFS transporter [Caulobacteraceae bacterium]